MRKISLQSRVKLAVLITFGALFVPIAAQAGTAGTYTGAGTVTIGLSECPALDTSYNTSVAARSVVLYSDTASAIANTDGATYIYFTMKDTTEWGAVYNYGSTQNLATCDAEEMTGTVTSHEDALWRQIVEQHYLHCPRQQQTLLISSST
jgi:hypothetical protein